MRSSNRHKKSVYKHSGPLEVLAYGAIAFVGLRAAGLIVIDRDRV
jgi:hypothetical protein